MILLTNVHEYELAHERESKTYPLVISITFGGRLQALAAAGEALMLQCVDLEELKNLQQSNVQRDISIRETNVSQPSVRIIP